MDKRNVRSGQNPKQLYRLGRRALVRHDAVKALGFLRSAVDKTLPDDANLAKYLYWVSICLWRLGRKELAIKSFSSAQKLLHHGYSRCIYERMVNGYGMIKTGSPENDDFQAFASIQIKKYLKSGKKQAFTNNFEKEVIVYLLVDSWRSLVNKVSIKDMSFSERIKFFHSCKINYPAAILENGISIITANFRLGKRVLADDRCLCGSGLPYRMCCGRTITPFEASNG